MPIRDFDNHYPHIAPTAYIDTMAVVIGEVTIEEYASLWPMVVARGDVNRISIGARTNIQDNTVLHVTHDGPYCPGGRALIIGEEVTVGHQVTLHACTIGHHCLIGIGSIVLDGAELQPYTLLAAGSLVSPDKILEGGYLWRGRPAQKVRPLTASELEYFTYSASRYVQLAQRYKTTTEESTQQALTIKNT
jgi:carbonic anhydrase/acetyltransferase-like protein (isoleucine patch superfamily)